jgi:DNA-binding MarR family transcriptional regulator
MADRRNTAPHVDQDLVARLLRLVNLIAKPFFSEYASRYHLSINDWRVMVALAARPRAAASEICEQTGMHPMNVSRSVSRLEHMGRVKRYTDARDRRRSLLRLTPAGRAVFGSIAPSAQAREEAVRRTLSARETVVLRALLDKLIARIGADAATGTATGARIGRTPRASI